MKATKEMIFVTKIVLTYGGKNCSSNHEKLLKFGAAGREFVKKDNLMMSENFENKIQFLTCSYRFLYPKYLFKLKLNLKKPLETS